MHPLMHPLSGKMHPLNAPPSKKKHPLTYMVSNLLFWGNLEQRISYNVCDSAPCKPLAIRALADRGCIFASKVTILTAGEDILWIRLLWEYQDAIV